MYQVTAIYRDSEIGYGEGEHDGFAVEDCIDSIDAIYRDNVPGEIRLIVRHSTGDVAYVTSMARYKIETEY